jgi:spore coat polysaccharide biosynthesis protein SpsF (cytidylyltransferase family)
MELRMATNPRQTIALIDLAVDSGTSASRLEHALRRLDGLTLLEWCIRRVSESTLIDSIVVTGHPDQRSVVSNLALGGAHWIASELSTPSARANEIATSLCADWVVFASPTCPFMDPSLLDRLVSRGIADPMIDFVGFVAPSRPTFSLQSLGLVAEMCSASALEKMKREGLLADPFDIPDLIRLHSSLFQSKLIPLPEALSRNKMRFQMENQDDWDRASTYLEAAGEDLSWQRLAQVAERDLTLR